MASGLVPSNQNQTRLVTKRLCGAKRRNCGTDRPAKARGNVRGESGVGACAHTQAPSRGFLLSQRGRGLRGQNDSPRGSALRLAPGLLSRPRGGAASRPALAGPVSIPSGRAGHARRTGPRFRSEPCPWNITRHGGRGRPWRQRGKPRWRGPKGKRTKPSALSQGAPALASSIGWSGPVRVARWRRNLPSPAR